MARRAGQHDPSAGNRRLQHEPQDARHVVHAGARLGSSTLLSEAIGVVVKKKLGDRCHWRELWLASVFGSSLDDECSFKKKSPSGRTGNHEASSALLESRTR